MKKFTAIFLLFIIIFSITTTLQPDTVNAASTGIENIVKRAKQMTQIQWTPKQNIVGWGSGVTYYAGVTYTGLPYGQPVNASYVPWSTSLVGFKSAVNDSGSKMYTSYSTYNKRAPYYSIDCSAFVSWAWGLSSRQTTSTIKNFATQISTSSYANAQIGDCLCKAGDHVVLITDITYNSAGTIDGIEISEATVNKATSYCCQVTRYGKNGTQTLSQLQSKYLNSGYILYRSKTRDTVTYTHSCAIPLTGDNCSSCGTNSGNNVSPSPNPSPNPAPSGAWYSDLKLADLGDKFTAKIVCKKSGNVLENKGEKAQVLLASPNGSNCQSWYFLKQTDGSYRIRNCQDGKFLDVRDAVSTNGTVIQCTVDTGSSAQYWQIYEYNGAYIIKSRLSDQFVLDLTGGNLNSGPLQLWEANKTEAQIFIFEKLTPEKSTLTVSAGYSKDPVKLSWTKVNNAISYNIRVYKNGTKVFFENDLTATSKSINLSEGTYIAYIETKIDWFTTTESNTVSFNVKMDYGKTTATLGISSSSIYTHEKIAFTFGGNNTLSYSNGKVDLVILKNGNKYFTSSFNEKSYTHIFTEEGSYTAYITAYGAEGDSVKSSDEVKFNVVNPIVSLTADKNELQANEEIKFNFDAANSGEYDLYILKDGILFKKVTVKDKTASFKLEIGEYKAFFTTKLANGEIVNSSLFYFTVTPIYNGFIEEDGNLFFLKDGKKVVGWFTDSDKTYYASSATNVVINYNKKIQGKYYIWNDTKGLVLADGFVTDKNGTKCYDDGIQVIGWRHKDGSGPKVVNGISEQYSQSPDKLYYFLSTTGYMVTDSTYKIGGYVRKFNTDHTVKPLNGLQTQGGELYYYVNGVKQTGWHTIDGTTYYFRASDAVYGRAATKWMYIGNKVYYFYASTSATPYALKDSGAISGITYTYSTDGYIVYNGFVNCDYANEANSNTAANIQKKNGTTRYYVNGEMQTGWQEINGNWYYFLSESAYMVAGNRSIGGVYYEFNENGICLSEDLIPKYTITFCDEYGTVLQKLYKHELDKVSTPSKTNHLFVGWFSEVVGGKQVHLDDSLNLSENVVVYARFKLNTFKVTFNANGGNVRETTRTVTANTAIGSLPSATKDYHQFLGWYTADGVKVNSDFKITGNITLTAKFELKPIIGWTLKKNVPSSAQIIKQKWTYTLREYTTSSSSSKSGWVKYDTKRTTGWGATQVSYTDPSNGVRNVWSEQYQVEVSRTHIYRYYRYRNSSGSAGSDRQSGTYHTYEAIEITFPLTTPGSYGYSQGYRYYYNGNSNYKTYWLESERDDVVYVTQTRYYYQEPTYAYTYYFYKDTNKESTTYPTGSNISNIVEYVQYREK